MKNTRGKAVILERAEEMGMLPIESEIHRVAYIIDHERKEIGIVYPRNNQDCAAILPFKLVRELAEVTKVFVN